MPCQGGFVQSITESLKSLKSQGSGSGHSVADNLRVEHETPGSIQMNIRPCPTKAIQSLCPGPASVLEELAYDHSL